MPACLGRAFGRITVEAYMSSITRMIECGKQSLMLRLTGRPHGGACDAEALRTLRYFPCCALRHATMNNIIYIVGLVVVVGAVLSFALH